MKAIFKLPLSKAEKEMVERVTEATFEERQKEQNKAIVRTLKMACIVLHQEFGFGEKRLMKFADEMYKNGRMVVDKPEQWYYIDEKLNSLGLNVPKEDINERESHSRDIYHENGRKFREYGKK